MCGDSAKCWHHLDRLQVCVQGQGGTKASLKAGAWASPDSAAVLFTWAGATPSWEGVLLPASLLFFHALGLGEQHSPVLKVSRGKGTRVVRKPLCSWPFSEEPGPSASSVCE